MFKRSIISLTVFVLLFSLCACERQTPELDEELQQSLDETQAGDYGVLPETTPTPSIQSGIIYRHGVVGLLNDQNGGSNIVLYNTEDWSYITLRELPNVTPDNYAAISYDGKYIAYTTWADDYSIRYLIVENTATKEHRAFYQDMPVKNEIIKISFMPDSHTIVFVKRDANISSYEEIRSFDIETGEEQTLVKGEVWQCKAAEDISVTVEPFYLKGSGLYLEVADIVPFSTAPDEAWHYYLTQDNINDICRQYGGSTEFSRTDINFMYVDLSAPRPSADGTKIAYSATLKRNSAPEGSSMWLATSVWIYDMRTGESNMIFAADDGAGIGRTDWTAGGVCFVTYYDLNGGRDSINYYDISKSEHTVIFPHTDKNYNNVTLLPVGDDKITFTSSAKEAYYHESDTILFDIPSNSYRICSIIYESDTVLLENFIYVRYMEMAIDSMREQ